MTKLQLTLTEQETDILAAKAAEMGYGLTRYVKYLIGERVSNSLEKGKVLPSFLMSRRVERRAKEARQEYEEGKTKKVKVLSELLA